jgi:hypothetical protein
MRRIRFALGLSAMLAASASGADPDFEAVLFHPKKVPSTPNCPPESKVDPKSPIDPKKEPVDPKVDPLARAPEAGVQAAESFNPNMFGDFFGSRPVSLTFASQRVYQTILTDALGNRTLYGSKVGTNVLTPAPRASIVVRDNGGASPSFQTTFRTTALETVNGSSKGIFENSTLTKQLQALNPGSTVQYLPSQSVALLTTRPNAGVAAAYAIEPAYRITTVTTTNTTLPMGGVVGRQTISEDNNPAPGDRVIFDYDMYSHTTLTPGGYDVSRFTVGGEYAVFDGMASGQLVLPFASTLDPVSSVGGLTNRDTVLGDLTATAKVLLVDGMNYNLATGVGVSLPTAPDAVSRGPAGNDLLRIRNESYFVTPFIAGSINPVDRAFAQAWVELSYDTTGSRLQIAPNGMGPLVTAGRIYDPTLLQTDVQLGYWVVQDPGLGVAPFVELHYNRPLGTGITPAAAGLALGPRPTYNEVDLTFGAAVLVGSFYVNVGMVVPLRDGPDKFFDYQLGIRANYFFGPGRGTAVPPGPGLRQPGM